MATVKLIFFQAPCITLLCFGFVMETVDSTPVLYLLLSNTKTGPTPFLSHTALPASKLGVQEVGRGYNWDSWIQLTKGIFPTIWHHAQYIKQGGRSGGTIHSELQCLYSQVTTNDEALLSWRWLNISLLMVSNELFPCFTLLVNTAFALPTWLSLPQHVSFQTFIPPTIPHPTKGGNN